MADSAIVVIDVSPVSLSGGGSGSGVLSSTTPVSAPPTGSGALSGLAEAEGSSAGSGALSGLAEAGGSSAGSGALPGNAEALGVSAGSGVLYTEANEAMAGRMAALRADKTALEDGGLGTSVGGSAVSERKEVNYEPTVGLTPDVQDNPGDQRTESRFFVEGEVELGRLLGVDLTAAGDLTLAIPAAPSTEFLPTALVLVSRDIQGLVGQPDVGVGVLAPGDVIASTALTFAANSLSKILSVTIDAQTCPVGQQLSLNRITPANATAYVVDAILFGRALR